MRLDASRPRTKHFLRATSLLIVGSAISLLGLAQCRLVDDAVTGVAISEAPGTQARVTCVHRCNQDYRGAKRTEESRHRAILRSCAGDQRCEKGENVRHQRAHHRLVAAMQACKRGCYNEGGGQGGR